jgi:hypothetical protein
MNESRARTGDSQRLIAAVARFDEENSKDPNQEEVNGTPVPRELLYSKWLTDWVLRLKPDASESLRLAARCTHLCRWAIPRSNYPADRPGYLRWRQDLKSFHSKKAAEILRELGYEENAIAQVQALVSKTAFPADPDSRVLEDALCLVFLEHQFSDLMAKSSEAKMINAVRKTWKKMTPGAQSIALTLKFEPGEKRLLERALSSGGAP